MAMEPLTWRQTLRRIGADHRRLVELLGEQQSHKPRSAYLHPSFVCALLYRISNHLHRRKHHWFARAVWHLNVLATGSDISEFSDLDQGLVVVRPAGVALMGKAGKNLTVMPCAGIGGEMGRRDDIGGGPGLPVLGDDVFMGAHSGILGPVRVGDRVHVGPGCAVLRDVGDDTMVLTHPPRFLTRRSQA